MSTSVSVTWIGLSTQSFLTLPTWKLFELDKDAVSFLWPNKMLNIHCEEMERSVSLLKRLLVVKNDMQKQGVARG